MIGESVDVHEEMAYVDPGGAPGRTADDPSPRTGAATTNGISLPPRTPHMSDGERTSQPDRPVEGRVSVDRRGPAETFCLLAADARVAIVRALAEPPGTKLSFAELFDRVDVTDSGNFSYHLDRLRGTFVRADDDGYRLTRAGEGVVGAILAGTYTAEATVPATPVDGFCQLCGAELVFRYDDETARIACTDCGGGRAFPIPPGRLDGVENVELPALTARWYRTHVSRVLDGFCPVCAGPVEGELVRGVVATDRPPEPVMAAFDCEHCGKSVSASVATIATFHPVVEGFLFECGFDTRDEPHSEIWGALDASAERTVGEDPLVVEVQFDHGGEVVTATIGPDASVTDAVRERDPVGSSGRPVEDGDVDGH